MNAANGRVGMRLAVVGAGRMGRLHIKTCLAAPDCHLAAVVDPHIAADRAGLPGTVEWLDTAGELPGRVDAAIIATPPETHARLTTELLAAGIHCLVEKPAAGSASELQAMQQAARQSGATLVIGHSERFNPAVERLLQSYNDGGVIPITRAAPSSPERAHRLDVVEDMLVHDIDWVLHGIGRALLGLDITACRFREAVLAAIGVRLHFGEGRVVNLSANRLAKHRKRTATIDRPAATRQFDLDAVGSPPDPLTRQLSGFLAAIAGRPSANATPDEVARVMEITTLIRQECYARLSRPPHNRPILDEPSRAALDRGQAP
jgi:hypothetical protein